MRSLADIVFLAALGLMFVLARQANADAPQGRYQTTASTVLDTKTGLTWQRVVVANTYPLSQAEGYCGSSQMSATLGGPARIPTVKELQTLVDYAHTSTTSPATIDSTAFPSTPNDFFWTASPYAGSSTDYWFVQFGNAGYVGHDDQAHSHYVRCVR
jgi:hypothetical protein